ncbi:MAG: phenylalanine--tRNA ligase subunit beta [Gammaproteobacteria bacterium]|nr:phenylalanine--tRNA ligase subunit beta [Gammaproteobacteria bacterium]MCP5196671.1 phenylalanine--tRNA ligase subunit beta [Gammaproteobacteria bacterium]
MKVSQQWLREWVDLPISGDELAMQLTMAGLEVDHIEPAAPPFDQVVVGQVVDLTPHPDADRLRIAAVDVGKAQPLQIVCGAPNVAIGMYVPTALIGAVLPGGLAIKKSKLRGIESQGMLCSAKELGLAENADGLLPLPADSPLGHSVRELLALDDAIIDIELTPNRGDCLGMEGIAREVAALNRCEFHPLSTEAVKPVLDATFPVRLLDPVDCPRYIGRVIRGVNPAAETPLWMQERLRRAGIRSLGPLVDVTNYVMLELGQPMHAFDLQRLTGGIEVRRARPGDRLELLNGVFIEPDEETLLITDHQGPLALAGIMGGEISSCTDATRDVFLESAFFTPTSIAGRARRHSLQTTDASYRFERGVDPQLQRRAAERATRLLIDMAGGQPGPIVETISPEHLPVEPAIHLRSTRIHKLLGMNVPAIQVEDILRRLGMAVAAEIDHWLVVPPSSRFDIALEADLIEEIARIYGYQRVPSNQPLTRLQMPPQPEGQIGLERLRETLVQRGFQEAITYSFVDPDFQKRLDPECEPLALANPISADLAVMRTSLWPGLLKALIYNQKHQQSRVRLFENGLNFLLTEEGLWQEPFLGGVATGAVLSEQWGVPTRTMDFFDLKADVEALLTLTGEPEAFQFVVASHPALHPGQSARVERAGESIGWLGALHPRVARELDVEGDIFIFELQLAGLRPARLPAFQELSRFPASRRDLAIIVSEDVAVQAVFDCIRQCGGALLREVWLFDIYRGRGIAEGRKSLAFGLNLQDFSRNLTDNMVDETVSGIIAGLTEQFDATLRI